MLAMACFFALLHVTFVPFNLLRKLAMIEHLICSDRGLHDSSKERPLFCILLGTQFRETNCRMDKIKASGHNIMDSYLKSYYRYYLSGLFPGEI